MLTVAITADAVIISVKTLYTPIAAAILAACSIDARANTWNDELYFFIPVSVTYEADAKALVSTGELAYWPDGNTIAIEYDPTPMSQGSEIYLASPCNIWGRALDDVTALSTVRAGMPVRVEISS